ncbi:MAG: succinate dehydrogenase/fumarate reductase flavoprotein subunit, partial [Caldilineae bacterium]
FSAEEAAAAVRADLERILNSTGDESAGTLREEMQVVMMDKVSVFREEPGMAEAVQKIRQLRERYRHIKIDDKSKRFNTDLLEAWELGCLLDLALVTAESALARTESRGAHAREDYKKRDDENWLKHTLAWLDADGNITLRYKPVKITHYQPKERVY